MDARKATRSCALAAAALTAGLWGCSSTPIAPTSGATALYEDILVLRSERKERVTPSTWCTPERTGFAPLNAPSLVEDRFHFWSVETRPADGRIVNANAVTVGELRACFGLTDNRMVFNFYLESTLGQLTVTGRGECSFALADMPEKGMSMLRCAVPLKVASDAYTGGLLVTSSMAGRDLIGLQSNPPGYIQQSIATIRLWRKH